MFEKKIKQVIDEYMTVKKNEIAINNINDSLEVLDAKIDDLQTHLVEFINEFREER